MKCYDHCSIFCLQSHWQLLGEVREVTFWPTRKAALGVEKQLSNGWNRLANSVHKQLSPHRSPAACVCPQPLCGRRIWGRWIYLGRYKTSEPSVCHSLDYKMLRERADYQSIMSKYSSASKLSFAGNLNLVGLFVSQLFSSSFVTGSALACVVDGPSA